MPTASKRKILMIDDDRALLEHVQRHFGELGYHVATDTDGANVVHSLKTLSPDLVVLDITLSNGNGDGKAGDGIDILRQVRQAGNVPVLMLSATNVAAVKVMALTMGADDYLSKPFDLDELGARIDAILRRTKGAPDEEKPLEFARLRIDPGERRVWKDGAIVSLTAIEFDILHTLAKRPHHVFTREKLLELAWKNAICSIPKVIDVHIGHTRRKIEDDPTNPQFIVTVRGAGYRFEA